MKAVAIDLSALGDPDPLWNDWLEDAHRRFRVDVGALDEELPNWRQLLERFAEERALSHLGAERHVEVLETGAGAQERVSATLGEDARVVNTRAELLAVT